LENESPEVIEYPFVRLEFDGPLAIMTLNDPERLNAMGMEMGESIATALNEIAEECGSQKIDATTLPTYEVP
jgi:2-(1,2-epoxy-1,2-dihydrophenyl)acetyl-CoA isomerase